MQSFFFWVNGQSQWSNESIKGPLDWSNGSVKGLTRLVKQVSQRSDPTQYLTQLKWMGLTMQMAQYNDIGPMPK